MLYSRKLTEHCKPAIMEKIKIIKIKKKESERGGGREEGRKEGGKKEGSK